MANLSLKQIKDLYYKQKIGVPEISNKLNISMKVIYTFMKKHNLSRRNLNEYNKILFQRKPLSFNSKKSLTAKERQLKIAGLMLYWAEGTGRGNCVDLANSNPEIIKLYLKFLRQIYQVDEKRLRVFLYCYTNQNKNELIKYWSKVTKISETQFSKPYMRPDYSLKNGREMKYGLIHIRYSDKKLLQCLIKEIDRYIKTN